MEPFLPPDLWSVHKEFSVHGTISSYVVFQNIVITAVLSTRFPPPNFCLYMCKDLEFIVRLEAFNGDDNGKKSIYITDGIENVGLSLHYIEV